MKQNHKPQRHRLIHLTTNMADFTAIERHTLHVLKETSNAIKMPTDQETDRPADILAQLSEKLKMNEPVRVSVQGDESGFQKYECTTPVGKYILALAASTDCSASAVQDQITELKCKLLVSFPERLANVVAQNRSAPFLFDAVLYWERLCDTVLLFYFAKGWHANNCEGVQIDTKHLLNILKVLIVSLLRRGKSDIMMRRLGMLPRYLFGGERFCERFAHLMEAAFEASKKPHFSLKSWRRIEVSSTWHHWNSLLFRLVEKRTEIKTAIISAVSMLVNSVPDDNSTSLASNIFNTVCVHQLSVAGPTRATARTIINDFLPTVAGAADVDNALTHREQECFSALFRKWENKEFVTSADLSLNVGLLHPIMYALLYMHKKKPAGNRFPDAFVGPLLTGVTIRLDSTRGSELRNSAMTVAAAYTALFVTSPDGVAPLLQDAHFSAALNEWMKEEPGTPHYAATMNTGMQMKDTPVSTVGLEMRVSTLMEMFPLDPDEEYHFFSMPSSHRAEKVIAAQCIHSPVSLIQLDSTEAPLPSFGQQKYAKDELYDHVPILTSIRECYNALVGVGRGPNAQLHEIQEATEGGLRGLSDAFSKLQQRIGSDLFNAVSKETGVLVPVLLPTLISLSIYSPEEQKQRLIQLRYKIIVDLIVLNPPLALNQLGEMVYRSNYGIYQRTELIKAIGEAASVLSQVEVVPEPVAATMAASEQIVVTKKCKQIYPPIPTHELPSDRKTSILVNEGKHTRRWGNAVVARQNRTRLKHYHNLLGDVATAFVAVFLHKLDADHFAFFQEVDPYTPCAILDSLTTVFQGITNVRHVAVELSEKNFDFFFTVCTRHPNLSVRKAAWTSVVEVMRTWCGVAPLWIRRKDGERVLNRDAVASSSLIFTKAWLSALEMLQHTCTEMVQKNDPCVRTALIAVSTLRDLVCDRDDFHSMLARVEEHALGE
ncbi:hypothetical protein LPMP_340800 [Leishmania panamensis]|uniref:Telomere length regulation protein conserved domain-containing protein n=1 Tax=Leishmania panamensis TaxID=5679 RepID=A0A088S0J6_LEIPA|nr:hypothetical protein LPMP_340800 [Leishmania panamensis]AIO01706.1 hypothetical protein LPMP_340800 [Leishmania panamensis]